MLKILNIKNILNETPLVLLKTIALLLPIFFVPTDSIQIDSAKFFVFYLLTGLAFLAFLAKSILDKKITIPNKRVLMSVLIIPLVFFVSAIFSNSFSWNIIGDGYETTTFLSIFALAIGVLLISVSIKDKEDVFSLVFLSVISYLIVIFYQILKVFVGPDTLSFYLFKVKAISLTGRINDLAIISGLVLLSSVIALSSLGLTKRIKNIIYVLISVSTISLLLINFDLSYMILFFVSLSILLFNLIASDIKIKTLVKKPLFYLATFTFVLSCLSFVSGELNSQGAVKHPRINSFYNYIPRKLNIVSDEVRPGFKTSYQVIKASLRENTLIGQGSNNFSNVWLKNKPLDINESAYWNTIFLFSVGYIPTLLATLGIIGLVSILSVIFFLMKDLVVSYIKLKKDNETMLSILIPSLFYLLIASAFYIPTLSTLFIFCILLGIYLSNKDKVSVVLKKSNTIKKVILSFTAFSFFILFLFTLFILISRYTSFYFYSKSATALNVQKDLDLSEKNILKAISFYKKDSYFKALAEINLLKAQTVYAKKKEELSDKEKQTLIAFYFKLARENALNAVDINKNNFYNYVQAADTLSLDKSLGGEAYELYQKAKTLNPNSPLPFLGEAKLKAGEGDVEKTKEYVAKSLDLKSNFTEGLLAAAQISSSLNNATDTVNFLAKAYYSDFSRYDLLKTISQILFGMGDIKGSISILESYVNKSGEAESLYNLSILYTKTGRYEDAIKALNILVELDKENKKIVDPLIEVLKNKKDPFSKKGQVVSTTTSTSTKKK